MKQPYLLLLILCVAPVRFSLTDPIDNIAGFIRQGNIHELSALFAPNVEIALLGEENVYSKVQAELILDKFFTQNKPKSVKMLHRINSNPNYLFGVLIVDTDKGMFRIACTLKQVDGSSKLIEMRIETEIVK
ncbi:MAG: hypothetical protein JWP45_1645 [Mucilaginibacter sp.]|nr:hypothetical protein [Mucilaginibacter sp.]